MTTTEAEAEAEEDDHLDYNNDKRYVGGGYVTRPMDRRQRRRRQQIDDRPSGLATKTECQFSLLSSCQ